MYALIEISNQMLEVLSDAHQCLGVLAHLERRVHDPGPADRTDSFCLGASSHRRSVNDLLPLQATRAIDTNLIGDDHGYSGGNIKTIKTLRHLIEAHDNSTDGSTHNSADQ